LLFWKEYVNGFCCADFEELTKLLEQQKVLQQLEEFVGWNPSGELENQVVCNFMKHVVTFCPELKKIWARGLDPLPIQKQLGINVTLDSAFASVRPFSALIKPDEPWSLK